METKMIRMSLPLTRVDAYGRSYLEANPWAYRDEVVQTSHQGNFKDPTEYGYSTTWYYNPKSAKLVGVAYDMYGAIHSKFYGPSSSLAGARCPIPDLANAVYNKALSKLVEKCRGGLDLSIDIAEHSSTRRMLAELGSASRYLSGFGVKRWANEWLQLQYGWLPLLSSAYAAADEMVRYGLGLMHVKAGARGSEDITGKVKLSDHFDFTDTGYKSADAPYVQCKGEKTAFTTFRINIDTSDSVLQASRWTSLNPVSIAWELVPYSFVFDWFYDVGSYLRDLESSVLLNRSFKSGCVTSGTALDLHQKIDYVATVSIEPYSAFVRRWLEESNIVERTLTRTVLSDFPGPRLPTVNLDLSWKRWVSAASLLSQKLLK